MLSQPLYIDCIEYIITEWRIYMWKTIIKIILIIIAICSVFVGLFYFVYPKLSFANHDSSDFDDLDDLDDAEDTEDDTQKPNYVSLSFE